MFCPKPLSSLNVAPTCCVCRFVGNVMEYVICSAGLGLVATGRRCGIWACIER